MDGLNLKTKDILTFIPSGKNYKKAIDFYLEIGFELDWQADDYCCFRKDKCRFILQNNPNNWGKDNFMMVLEVENLDDWWTHKLVLIWVLLTQCNLSQLGSAREWVAVLLSVGMQSMST